MGTTRPIATLPPSEDADYWVELGQWGVTHADPGGIPFDDYGDYVCDWFAQCGVCSADACTEVPIPFHPKHLGWEVLGEVGKGRTWCGHCGASVWASLVRIRFEGRPVWTKVAGLEPGL